MVRLGGRAVVRCVVLGSAAAGGGERDGAPRARARWRARRVASGRGGPVAVACLWRSTVGAPAFGGGARGRGDRVGGDDGAGARTWLLVVAGRGAGPSDLRDRRHRGGAAALARLSFLRAGAAAAARRRGPAAGLLQPVLPRSTSSMASRAATGARAPAATTARPRPRLLKYELEGMGACWTSRPSQRGRAAAATARRGSSSTRRLPGATARALCAGAAVPAVFGTDWIRPQLSARSTGLVGRAQHGRRRSRPAAERLSSLALGARAVNGTCARAERTSSASATPPAVAVTARAPPPACARVAAARREAQAQGGRWISRRASRRQPTRPPTSG